MMWLSALVLAVGLLGSGGVLADGFQGKPIGNNRVFQSVGFSRVQTRENGIALESVKPPCPCEHICIEDFDAKKDECLFLVGGLKIANPNSQREEVGLGFGCDQDAATSGLPVFIPEYRRNVRHRLLPDYTFGDQDGGLAGVLEYWPNMEPLVRGFVLRPRGAVKGEAHHRAKAAFTELIGLNGRLGSHPTGDGGENAEPQCKDKQASLDSADEELAFGPIGSFLSGIRCLPLGAQIGIVAILGVVAVVLIGFGLWYFGFGTEDKWRWRWLWLSGLGFLIWGLTFWLAALT